MEAPARWTVETGGEGPRILLVEDEVGMLEVLTDTLAERIGDVRIRAETRPLWAAGLLEQGEYDLLIVDHRMPGMNGIQLIEVARKFAPKMPVMMVTGYPTAENAEAARELGVCAYLRKPFEPEELLQAVEDCLGSC